MIFYGNDLAPNRRQNITCSNDDPFRRHTYASPCLHAEHICCESYRYHRTWAVNVQRLLLSRWSLVTPMYSLNWYYLTLILDNQVAIKWYTIITWYVYGMINKESGGILANPPDRYALISIIIHLFNTYQHCVIYLLYITRPEIN